MKARNPDAMDMCHTILQSYPAPPRWKKYLKLMNADEKQYKEARSTLSYFHMRQSFIKEFSIK